VREDPRLIESRRLSTRNSDRDKVDLIVTGGGTGGHVFPALEIADAARSAGCRVRYFGSLRGQERDAAAALGFEFLGFPSEPLYGFRTLRGWRAALSFLRARSSAKLALKAQRPTIVFSTGGYASAPIVSASRSLGIPYVIHEQNSVPGRTNKILSRGARAVATVFHASAQHFPDGKVVRTGMPVRRVLRDAAKDVNDSGLHILVMGGSQGATALYGWVRA
jgi:UDP-N-acetylglucosamine--N-acetylmuramyl-(pentapeptide) pyrophosphoryl-undecaprenol N-acetylglucosamine transferase